MRGLLRITAGRSPYLRAGLTFPLAGDVDIRDLDGERLLELVRDPVLTVLVGDDDGEFRPAPELVGEIDASDVQLMIDAVASEMPERLNAPDVIGDLHAQLEGHLETARAALETIDGQVKAAGFETLADLISDHSSRGSQLADLRSQLREANSALSKLDELGGATAAKALADRVPVLEADLADAKAEITALKARAPTQHKGGKASGDKPAAEQK